MFVEPPEDKFPKRTMPTDHEIEEVTADNESIAYGLYALLCSHEDHYNNLQNKYKGLTVTWVIATFIAIGYLLSGYEKGLSVSTLLIITFLSILAATGVFLLWYLDVMVYDKLIRSIYHETCRLEQEHEILGKTHLLGLRFLGKETAHIVYHGYFYIFFILFLLFIACLSLSGYLYFIHKWLLWIIIPLFVLVSSFILVLIIKPGLFKKLFFKKKV